MYNVKIGRRAQVFPLYLPSSGKLGSRSLREQTAIAGVKCWQEEKRKIYIIRNLGCSIYWEKRRYRQVSECC